MDFDAIGDHKATEFSNWLRSEGHEVYLVGGIVRDLLAGTKPESKASDSEILESMKDVDIVSTGNPQVGKMMMQTVAKDVPNAGITYAGPKWGVTLAAASGDSVGLDYCAMSANYEIHTDKMAWDHLIEDDVVRRDFACNALYYDPHNKVIIDPTGKGIADAQNKVLRPAASPKDAIKDDRLHYRFWKFRIRGYSAEEKALKYMRKHAEHWFQKQTPDRISHNVFNVLGKKGGNIHKHLFNLEKVMSDDGCLDLFQKYIEPVRKDIIQKAKDYKG
jgi:tRNA nucleotidyltransferase/poly(A) polymerase